MKYNVPYDVAFSLPEQERIAYCIILQQTDGAKWDWDLMRWKDPT